MAVSQNAGPPTNDDVAPTKVAASRPSLEQVILSTVRQEATRITTVDDDEDNADTAPTSWSFAARQRSECSRIARVFRYARHRMRQELRGLALDHAELLLSTVTRTVATIAEGRGSGGAAGVSSPTGTARGHRSHERPQVEHGGFNLEGEGDSLEEEELLASQLGLPRQFEADGQEGGKPNVHRSGRNLRHEAQPHEAWNNRRAMAVDKDSMGELSTLGLEESMLEGDTDAGWEARAGVGADTLVEWRKAFRKRVCSTGGSRHPRELSANRRHERNSVYN